MTRLQRILAIVLVVQIVLAAVVFWPRNTASADSGPLFAGLETADIAKLTITDNQGQQVQLQRQGGGWVLAGSGDYPADSGKIEPVLAKIAALQTGRLIARSESSHKRLQVAADDFLRRIEMERGDGSVETLFLGTAPNPQATNVRRDGENETYLAGGLSSWEVAASAQNWIDAAYLTLSRNEITRLVLENGNGSFQFDKQDDGTWTMVGLGEGEALNMDNFNPILTQASNMRMAAPLGLEEKPEYGLDDPQVKLSITTTNSEDGSSETSVLRVGAKLGDSANYVVKWSESSYYVSAADFSVKNMITRTREELVQIPPTPEG